VNTSTNPAAHGSVVSVFVNGLAPNPDVQSAPVQLSAVDGWSVTNIVQVNPFVLRVDVQTPPALPPPGLGCNGSLCRLTLNSLYESSGDPHSSSTVGQAFGGVAHVQ
jgi:hypothetical protein